ncbi:hypothetical protein [Allobaculum stercoricanis]|uniref:hypothetical protein n=1 Tax=Allobaculum stercoricanis TaxID=174709 RepID=UPI002943168D|nr:hypothetical protein [Allobaculum stercoricanis]
MDLIVRALPNKEVTLTGDKCIAAQTTDETGKAVFNNLKPGRYVATTTGVSGNQQQKEIVLLDEYDEHVPVGQIKDLPIGSKIKFSNGNTFVLKTKDTTNTGSNEFISEFIIEDSTRNTSNYSDGDLFNKTLSGYYTGLKWFEKESILLHKYKYIYSQDIIDGRPSGKDNVKQIQSYFYVQSESELRKLTKEQRVKRYKNGNAGAYFTRDGSNNSYYSMFIFVVDKTGNISTQSVGSGTVATSGVVALCNINKEAYVGIDSDGYYRILGM